MALLPRESAKLIAGLSNDVSIDTDHVTSLAKKLHAIAKAEKYSLRNWLEHELNPQTQDREAVNWMFVIDTLNFSFWSENPAKRYVVKYKGKEFTGYWSLCAAMRRALDEGIPVTDPKFYSIITKDQLESILRSDSDFVMPLIDERLQCLHEVGKVLLERYDGSFANCIAQCGKSAQALMKTIVKEFPCFRDEAEFEGQTVAFYKRAQILIADIWSCCQGLGLGKFNDIDTITMFADYRVPQALMFFNVLKYSDSLMEALKTGHVFKSGDRAEVEIRGCSIWAIELIHDEILKLSKDADTDIAMNSILIDNYLWDYRRDHNAEMENIPFHFTRCIYY